jgi:hypothetical protein
MMPKLSGHSVLHKDRRFVVFRVSSYYPFEGYGADWLCFVDDWQSKDRDS